jgi:hypothetical protein
MTARIRSRLSYANVVATLALFLVVAGGSVALGGGRSQQSGQALQQQLKHNVKKVKGLVKDIEAQQDTSDQQTLGKLDNVHNAVIDAHVQLASKLDTTLARLKALCHGQAELWDTIVFHDETDRAFPTLRFHPGWQEVCLLFPD